MLIEHKIEDSFFSSNDEKDDANFGINIDNDEDNNENVDSSRFPMNNDDADEGRGGLLTEYQSYQNGEIKEQRPNKRNNNYLDQTGLTNDIFLNDVQEVRKQTRKIIASPRTKKQS